MLGPRKLRYQRFKEWLLNRVYRQKSSANDRLVDRATSFAESNASKFTVDVTNAQTIVTDIDEDATSRQGVSVTKVKRAAVDSAANNSLELKDIENERRRSAVSTRHASIRIGPLNKLRSIEESETIQPNKTVINSVNEFTFSTRKTRSVLLTTVPIDLASFKYFPS